MDPGSVKSHSTTCRSNPMRNSYCLRSFKIWSLGWCMICVKKCKYGRPRCTLSHISIYIYVYIYSCLYKNMREREWVSIVMSLYPWLFTSWSDQLIVIPTSVQVMLTPSASSRIDCLPLPTSSMRNSAAAPPVLWISSGSVGCQKW